MAKAKKLASGSWRTLVYDYTDNKGKRHYKSFTADSKKESEYLAAQYTMKKDSINSNDLKSITFGQACENYIAIKEHILSPSTIRSYKAMQRTLKTNYKRLYDKNIAKLDKTFLQAFINELSASRTPKTVRNYNGLIYSVLDMYDVHINCVLPGKQTTNLYLPSDEEIKTLITEAMGTELEIPIYLAAFGPMRRGEICALDSDHINGNIVFVENNMVKNDNKEWVIKGPKTEAGTRYIEYPDFVAEKLKSVNGRVTLLTPDALTNRFKRLQTRIFDEQFRFHDLRHYSASIQHALGIPDAYIMKRGGWKSDTVLKRVYRHAMDAEQSKMNNIANSHFSSIMQHEMQHEK